VLATQPVESCHPPSPWFGLCGETGPVFHRLICFPHGGGGASAFGDWVRSVPSGLHICAVRLPGRESRLAEPPETDLRALVSTLSGVVADSGTKPFALFGSCDGAVLGLELARELARRRSSSPSTLFVCGQEAPHLPRAHEIKLHALPREPLIAELTNMGGLPEEVAANEELMQLVEPSIRADFRMFDTRIEREPPVTARIVGLHPAADDTCDPARMEPWGDLTTTSFSLVSFRGGRFPLAEAREELMEVVIRELRS
jgi:medium-chain acyl-[acyl-carrier-protein] hydrolase